MVDWSGTGKKLFARIIHNEGKRALEDFSIINCQDYDSSNLEKLKSIKTPTLLIWGAKDTWIPLDNGKRMDSALPNSKLVVLENSGHVPMEENPTESLAIFRAFLNE